MNKEKLKSEIEFKKRCIFYTERVIVGSSTDGLSMSMRAQAERLKTELLALEEELKKLKPKQKVKKSKQKQPIKKTKRGKK